MKSEFLHPRYWGLWLKLGLLRALICLPFRWQRALGRAVGDLLWHVARSRRRIAEINIARCMPELSATEQQQLVRENFRQTGMTLLEMGQAWWSPDSQLQGLAEFEGLQHLEQALTQGRGVLLLSAHFVSLEMGGRLLVQQVAAHFMFRPHKNPLFDWVQFKAREHRAQKVIPREDVRSMLRSLKQGFPVWYAADQDYGAQHSVFAPFYGIQAASLTATARFARLSKAPVVPFFCYRKPDGRYRLVLLPALDGFPSGNDVEDASRINQLLEQAIKQAPEQYLWVHRRFKTRPPGEADFYRKS